MAASMSTDDSSSEDEETLARLKEAAVETNVLSKCQIPAKDSKELSTIGGRKETVPINSRRETVDLKSLRPDKQNKEDYYRAVIETTPGVRRHIAKKLSSVLDSEIDSSATCFCPVTGDTPVENAGVKLLQQSSRFIPDENETSGTVKKQKKRRPPSPSSDSSEDEKLAEAAVSHDFVITQSSQPYFSNNKPPEIIVKSKIKTDDSIINSNSEKTVNESGEVNNEQDSDNHAKVHKKKKKKKHKKCHEDG